MGYRVCPGYAPPMPSWVLWRLSTEAWPCAGLTHEPSVLAESDSSVALFEVGEGEIAVTYEVTYEGDAPDLGWVIPVPGEVSEVEDGEQQLLDELLARSAPEVLHPSSGEQEHRGCCLVSTYGVRAGASNAVEVLAEGFTGTYDYVVVSADEPQALSG
jgi:hypothetical protein